MLDPETLLSDTIKEKQRILEVWKASGHSYRVIASKEADLSVDVRALINVLSKIELECKNEGHSYEGHSYEGHSYIVDDPDNTFFDR